MISQSISAGFASIRQRFGLVLLLYAINLLVALALALPLFLTLRSVVGPTGFGPDLLNRLDLMILTRSAPDLRSAFQLVGLQLLWVVPVFMIWKVASSVGVINAVRDGRVRKFWAGVGEYTIKGIGLAMIFVLLAAVWVGLCTFGTVFVRGLLGGTEEAAYKSIVYFLPAALAVGLIVLSLWHDYSQITLVKSRESVFTSFKRGVKFALRNPGAWTLFTFWLILSAILLLAPTVLDSFTATGSFAAVLMQFAVQQLFFLLRSAATVGWLGSEVEYYESKLWKDLPLIAETPIMGPEISFDEPGF